MFITRLNGGVIRRTTKMGHKLKSTGMAVANSVSATPTTQPEVLTVAETAEVLKVPVSSIYEWTRYRGGSRGTPLPHRKIGKYLRFVRSEVLAWLLALPQAPNSRKRAYRKAAAA